MKRQNGTRGGNGRIKNAGNRKVLSILIIKGNETEWKGKEGRQASSENEMKRTRVQVLIILMNGQ